MTHSLGRKKQPSGAMGGTVDQPIMRPEDASAKNGTVASVVGSGIVRHAPGAVAPAPPTAPSPAPSVDQSAIATTSTATTATQPQIIVRVAAPPPPLCATTQLPLPLCVRISDARFPSPAASHRVRRWATERAPIVEPADAAALLCAPCQRRLQDAADLIEALRSTQASDPAWLPRTRRAALCRLRHYERIEGADGGAGAGTGGTVAPARLASPWLDAGNSLFAYERALLAAAANFWCGRDRPLPPGTAVGCAIADWIVRCAVTDCAQLHGGAAAP